MKKTLLSLVAFAATLPLSSFATPEKAQIRWGWNYENVMEQIAEDRVSGRLKNLVSSGVGEDQEFTLVCYEGSPKEVCALLQIAVDEENDKQDLKGKSKLHLVSCRLLKQHLNNLSVQISSARTSLILGSGVLGTSSIPQCSRL